ncbi:MAG: hypothetical protein QHJ82_04330 [Verrucomicrobiota bacterium]|nr:hypothetical protein [Verrucomicrobiota bacterium]
MTGTLFLTTGSDGSLETIAQLLVNAPLLRRAEVLAFDILLRLCCTVAYSVRIAFAGRLG